MCRIGIIFELAHAETRFGEKVVVTGSAKELGLWNAPSSAVELTTNRRAYPSWKTASPIWITVPTHDDADDVEDDDGTASTLSAFDFDSRSEHGCSQAVRLGSGGPKAGDEPLPSVCIEYKYLKDRRSLQGNAGPSVQWEDSIANRVISLPLAPGAIYIVTDSLFNDSSMLPIVKRTTLIDLWHSVVQPEVNKDQLLQLQTSGVWDDSTSMSSRSSYSAHSSSTICAFTFSSSD